jgi:hypothetical protein
MVPRRAQPQLAPAITATLAGVQVGAQAFAFVGTDLTNRSKAVGFKWRSGVRVPGRRAFLGL